MLLISPVSIGKPLDGGFFGHDCSEKYQEQSVVSNRLAGEITVLWKMNGAWMLNGDVPAKYRSVLISL